MVIRIENLGPVKKVDIDLSKPMIILTGLNGTGKTYVLYAIYAILKMFIPENDILGWTKLVDSSKKSKVGILDVDKIYDIFQIHLKNVNEIIGYTFGIRSKSELIQEAKFSLITSKKQLHEELLAAEFKIHADGVFDFLTKENTLEYSLENLGEDLEYTDTVNYIVIKGLLFNSILEDIEPSDRGGLSTFIDEIEKGLKQKKIDTNSPSNRGKYRQPMAISRFLFDMKMKFENSSRASKYGYLADEIETEIMHGHLSISKSEEIIYRREGMKEDLPLSLSSSGVKTICSIILFLKNTVMDCNMLIIDEPEINLHPKYQVMIARILAKIVNAGIRLIISTHSDYIIRELNNMIMLSSIKDEKTVKKLGYTKDLVLTKDDVAPYYFEFQEGNNVIGKEEDVTKTGFSISEIDKVINSQVETSQNIYEIIEEI